MSDGFSIQEAVAWVTELRDRKPGNGPLVDLHLVPLGSQQNPWTHYFPRAGRTYDYLNTGEVGKTLLAGYLSLKQNKGFIRDDDVSVYGLGSAYLFVDCATDEVIYVGSAGHTPFHERIISHLLGEYLMNVPAVDPAAPFPKAFGRKWIDNGNSARAAVARRVRNEIVRTGNFYVMLVANLKPWGDGARPVFEYAFPGPGEFVLMGPNQSDRVRINRRNDCPTDIAECRRGLNLPYDEIGRDLESWIMLRGDPNRLPSLNQRYEAGRWPVDPTLPWGNRS